MLFQIAIPFYATLNRRHFKLILNSDHTIEFIQRVISRYS